MNNPIIEKAIDLAGGTQEKLALKSGVSQSAIHKLLTKKNGMRLKTARALSNATGIALEEFVSQ